METRYVAIVALHLVVALVFAAVAVRNLLHGDVPAAVMQGVLAVLVAGLGVGIVRLA